MMFRVSLKNKRVYAALLIAVLFSFASAQAQVTDTLKEVRIKAEKKKAPVSNDERVNTYAPGQTIITIDSVTLEQYKFQQVSNLLSQQVSVFVRSYGLNNVATLNFRGASAAQSQVYWNGVPIQNAALGIADVSLLPVSLMNKVNVVYGSSAAMWGSGNVGGALLVENDLPGFDSNSSFMQSASAVAASFNNYRLGLKSAISTPKFVLSVNAFGQTGENNFLYTATSGGFAYSSSTNKTTEVRMSNAELQSGVVLAQAGYKVNEHNTLGIKAWYQQYYREIPPALFESGSVKNQRDESLRLLFNWDRNTGKMKNWFKASYVRDFMWYRDSLAFVDSKNITNQLYGEAGLNYRINYHHKFMLFIPVQVSWIDRVLLGDIKTQNKYALAGSYLYTGMNNKLNAAINARAAVINDLSVLLPGINASYDITRWLRVKGNIQKTYRVPTLNELYYNPGGNTSLKPEQGWNEDVGYVVNKRGRLTLYHSLSLFNRLINNWILWFGGAIWTPHNIASVHSRGIETENKVQYRLGAVRFHAGINTSYVLATTTSSDIPGDGSIGKQIPYTPRYNGQANFGFTWKGLYFNYNHTYTGVRFITTDESSGLGSYSLGNLQLMYSAHIGQQLLQFTGQCNNIWGTEYQVVNARPMPGINWLFGINMDLNYQGHSSGD